MAGRRDRNLIALVADMPWWAGIVAAIVVFAFLKYGYPVFAGQGVLAQSIARGLSQAAWIFALPFLIAAIFSAFWHLSRKRLLDRQVNLDSIRALSWQEFEFLVGEVFRRQGYDVEERGGSTPDGGIDLVLRKDGRKTVVQCKHWQTEQVGVRLVRELYGVMTAENADKAIFVSSGEYTNEARAFADGNPIQLIDGGTLLGMIRSVQPAGQMPNAL